MGENESKLLTIGCSQQTGWRSHTVCVPAGTYSIGFVASVGMSRKPYIGVDEVQLVGPCISNLNTTGDRLTHTYKSAGCIGSNNFHFHLQFNISIEKSHLICEKVDFNLGIVHLISERSNLF